MGRYEEDRGDRRGFASMDDDRQREISRRGGEASAYGRGGWREQDDRGYSSRGRDRDDDRGQSSRSYGNRGYAGIDEDRQRENAWRGGEMTARMQERDERGRFGGEDDDRGRGRGGWDEDRGYSARSARGGQERDEYGRFTSDDDRGDSSRGRDREDDRGYPWRGRDRDDDDRGSSWRGGEMTARMQERDEYGRFVGEDDGRDGWTRSGGSRGPRSWDEDRGYSSRDGSERDRDQEGRFGSEGRGGGRHDEDDRSRSSRSSGRGSSQRGFASWNERELREVASRGGRAAHESGHAHEFTPREARRAAQERWH